MRKIFSLFTAILFAASMMATDVEVIIYASSGNFYGKTQSWANGTQYDQVVLDEVITANRIGTGNNGKYYTDWRFYTNGSTNGSFSIDAAAGYELQSATFTYTVSNSGALYFGETKLTSGTAVELSGNKAVFQCKNTNSSTNGQVRLTKIAVTYVASQGGGEQEGTVKTVYCKVTQGWWTVDGAATGIYAYADGNVENAAWPGVRMEAVEGEEGLWKADIDTAVYHNIIFTRFNPNDCDTEGCLDYGAKTGDLAIPADKDLYTITSTAAVWGDPGVEGEWSVYTPAEPAEDITFYLINNQEWETPTAHVFAGTTPEAAWPGNAMTKTADQVNGFDVYSYTFKDNFTAIIFNDGAAENIIQTVDLTWDKTKPYFVPGDKNGEGKFDGTWYATMAEIPAPAVPVEGNIWKAIGTTPVLAGSHYIDEDLIKMDGVYATTLKTNARTIAGEEFTHAIQVRTDGYPSATNVIGAERSGSTPLIITAKENIEVTFYYNRQVVGEGGTCNDNKDLIVFDQAAPTVKMEGDFVIDQILSGNSYLNATKKVMLEKDHVYTVTASGTTIQLCGVKFGIPVPAKFYITGDSALVVNAGLDKEQAWNPAAIKSTETSYKLNLAAGDYMLKITLDGTWGEGKVLGYDAMTYKKDGLTRGEGQANDNICFTLTEAGEVSVHYDGEFFFLSGNFYVAPVEVKYYLKNNWDGGEWTWREMTKNEEDGTYLLEYAVFGGSGVNINTSASDEGARYVAAENIMTMDMTIFDVGVLGVLDTVAFVYDPEEYNSYKPEEQSGLSAYITGKYVAPEEPTLANGYYLVGDKYDWTPAAERILTVNPENENEYMVSATLAVDDSLKVVRVENDVIITWYPEGDNYVVDAAHAGEKTIYFRPDYQGGIDWHNNCIYVAPNSGTAIDKVAGEAKAVKILKNGMLIIEKNGVKYNVLGVRL